MAKGGNNKGFTLIELLIVVVVIATMMGILFRLAGVGGDQKARNVTISRMQKLEFALSGYYAAFGSYPPVQLHGSRDIFCSVNDYGIQVTDGSDSSQKLDWKRVRAACLSQPVAVEFPINSRSQSSKDMHSMWQQKYAGQSFASCSLLSDGDRGMFPNAKQLQKLDGTLWQKVQQFKFGVLSFLLPRYLFMLDGPTWLYDSEDGSVQWNSQNDLKTLFNFENGKRLFSDKNSGSTTGSQGAGWEALQDATAQYQYTQMDNYQNQLKFKRILMQPSQSVCARWIQAFDGVIFGGNEYFGVNTLQDHDENTVRSEPPGGVSPASVWMSIYSASPNGPKSGSGGNLYRLEEMTILDGWGEDIFYYSPPPYQSYRVWSSGPNGKTIPPWVDFESTQMRSLREEAARWIADDIVGLSTPAN